MYLVESNGIKTLHEENNYNDALSNVVGDVYVELKILRPLIYSLK